MSQKTKRHLSALLSVLLLLTVITGMIGCRKDGDGTITTVTPGTSLSTPDTTAPGTDEPTGTSDAATSAPGADGTTGTSPDTSAPDTSAPDSTTDTPATSGETTTAKPDNTTSPSTSGTTTATDAPTTSETPAPVPGKVLYYENFDKYGDISDSKTTLSKLGWNVDTTANGAYKNNTSLYSIKVINGSRRLYISNISDKSTDSYVIVLTAAQFGAYHEKNYTYQYDLIYDSAADASRYIALVSDYNGQAYNSFHFRNRGTANSQLHYFSQWYTYDGGTASSTGSGSIVKKLLGKNYSENTQVFSGVNVSIRYVVDWTRGNSVYMRVNTPGYPGTGKWTLVSKGSAKATEYFKPESLGGAIVLKTGGKQCGYVDNIIIWEGTGDEPTDKSSPLLTSTTKGCSGHRFVGGESCQNPSKCTYCGAAGSNTKPHNYVSVPGTSDTRCTVCHAYGSNASSSWLLKTVPSYQGGKYSSALYRSGQGIKDPLLLKENESLMAIISKTNASGFDDYCKKLESYGYTQTYTNMRDGNLYAQYTEDGQIIYTYYTASAAEVRVVLDKNSDCANDSFGYTYTAKEGDRTILYQYGVPMHSTAAGGNAVDTDGQKRINCGMMYVMKLADNSVYILDGGGYQQFDDAQCDGFMAFLREITGQPTGKIRIAAWSVSHGHSDHMGGAALFFKKYCSQLTLERVFFNLPSYYTSTTIFTDGRGNHSKLITYIQKYFGNDVKFIQVHTGQSFYLADVKINVMYTHEDIVNASNAVSNVANDFNNSSTVLDIEFNGKSFWLLGDINAPAANVIIKNNSAETLKCDIVQVAHHVYNRIESLYNKMQASVVLVPQSSGGAVKSAGMRSVMNSVKKYAQDGMIYYAGDGTDGIEVKDGKLTHVYHEKVLGGGYTGWSW